MVVDSDMYSLDELLAVIEFTLPGSLMFRCRVCNRAHRLTSNGWKKCYYSLASNQLINPDNTKVYLTQEGIFGDTTTFYLPGILMLFPKIILYKLALRPFDEASMLLAQYSDIISELYPLTDLRTVTIFDRSVPLSIILTGQQYRELAYRLMIENGSYREYVNKLKRVVTTIAEFVRQYPDLFVPYTPTKVIVNRVTWFDNITYTVSANDRTVRLDELLGAATDMLKNSASLHNDAYIKPENWMIINGWTIYSLLSNSYAGGDAQFKFILNINIDKGFDNTDAVTLYLVNLIDQLKKIAAPAIQALSDYAENAENTSWR